MTLATGVSELSVSPATWVITILTLALRILVRTVLQGLMILLIGYAIPGFVLGIFLIVLFAGALTPAVAGWLRTGLPV